MTPDTRLLNEAIALLPELQIATEGDPQEDCKCGGQKLHALRLYILRRFVTLLEALRAAPPATEAATDWQEPNCPTCGKRLQRVRQSPNSMLNADQFDSVKAGDWFCDKCQSNGRGQAAYCYFWNHELPAPEAERRVLKGDGQ